MNNSDVTSICADGLSMSKMSMSQTHKNAKNAKNNIFRDV